MNSVIIPAYNAGRTIGKCLEALLDQSVTASSYEIIVVDDGSTDNTAKIVQRYESVCLLSQPRQGPAAARNLGVGQAGGEIFLFTDADCAPARTWIEETVKPFENPEIVGVKGAYQTRQKELIPRFVQIEYENKYDKMKKDRYIDFVDTYSAGYRRAVFEDCGGFDPVFSIAAGEDIEFSHRLAERGYKMVFAPRAIVYHQHPDSLSKYLRRKFNVGFWRVVRYQRYPRKIIRDSHTPQTLKMQVGLAVLLGMVTLGTIVWQGFSAWIVVLLILFFLSGLPFCSKALNKDLGVGLISPLLLFLRAIALGFGLGVGFVHQLMGRWRKEEGASKSANTDGGLW